MEGFTEEVTFFLGLKIRKALSRWTLQRKGILREDRTPVSQPVKEWNVVWGI